ncbi:LysR family transcriptional regulator [Burkholderia glumae]|uniref:LysR family transcriptional regulator n=1 Tax=Burkholderia glumae TaxID=337 RepID=UPI00148EA297|nr:LysR family transcriptional regulator [Burkholderia glumae]MCQ0029484.1 LysR family transcriptional regulator [Burkholderia glumae]MCQ0039784.1 LysR family transcriptional regulator [Burkholderia glumae]QJW78439.1 LysR family transcriptional regulator [Burkholderia glumae]UVS83490.1 LysR family transcriptional regulator [Burkholderia glumae]
MDRLSAMASFVAAIETGSFSAAARRLGIGQPAVSKSIANLERQVGVPLLARTTHGLMPTEAGQQYYERARRLLDDADEAEQAVRGAGASLAGTLRVGVPVAFARLQLVPALESFLDAHPDLVVELLLDDRHADLGAERIDVALRIGQAAAAGGSGTPAGVRKIGESPRRVVGSHAYFARAGIPHLPQDLARHQVVVHDRRAGGAVWTFRRHDTVLAVETSGRLRVREAEGVRAAALAGLGLAIGSDWLFADALRDGRLAAALEGWTLPPAELWAAFPAGRPATSRARAFVAFVEAMLGVAAAQRDLA